MTDPILTLSEEQLFGPRVPAGSPEAGRNAQEKPWTTMQAEPPENVTLELLFGAGDSPGGEPAARADQAVLGWMSKRFLGGTPTYWAWIDGKVELVRPRRWRLSDRETCAP